MNINWHRLFGLLLIEYFSNRDFRVELEKELSLKRQYLDVVIVERIDEKQTCRVYVMGLTTFAVITY